MNILLAIVVAIIALLIFVSLSRKFIRGISIDYETGEEKNDKKKEGKGDKQRF